MSNSVDIIVVGSATVKSNQLPSTYPDLDKANEVLEAAGLPIRLQTYGWTVGDDVRGRADDTSTALDLSVGANKAESMLLDWITDAEIGEGLFNALFHLDNGMTAINEVVGSDALVSGKGARAWGQLTEARRMWAAHLRWLDEAATRRGRTPLAEYDRELIAE